MKPCPKCGIMHEEEATYCSICNTAFDTYDKERERKKLEKQMDSGGAIIAAGFAFFIPILLDIISLLILGEPINLFTILMLGIPGIIIVSIGFIIFGQAFSQTK